MVKTTTPQVSTTQQQNPPSKILIPLTHYHYLENPTLEKGHTMFMQSFNKFLEWILIHVYTRSWA